MDKKKIYFRKQRLTGVILLVLSVIASLLDGGIAAVLFLGPIGLLLIFSKEMILMNDYFFEVKETNKESGSN